MNGNINHDYRRKLRNNSSPITLDVDCFETTPIKTDDSHFYAIFYTKSNKYFVLNYSDFQPFFKNI
jgi:hypothetical protein